MRENPQGDFDTHLLNGDPLHDLYGARAGRPPPIGEPPFAWEESAEDAMRLQDNDEWTDWSILVCFSDWKNTMALGTKNVGAPSPYLWSFSY